MLAADLLSEVQAPPCLSRLTDHEHGSMTLFDNVYVDDAAFMILADTASGIVNKAVAVAQIVRSLYSSYFLLINMKPGKSEIMFRLCGDSSKVIWHDLINVRNSKLPIDGSWFIDSVSNITNELTSIT